ncbi:MAG: IGHMBP2 family helicase [Epsilonproteobacteria bacterium]|nr:IGHMBP2 family helicase [Campylobacterota bacterium]NPA56593.1 IGHMBP2 family helicase [Campylobacterota bacterium]
MACFILTQKLEGNGLKRALRKYSIKLSDIKRVYYANGKSLICLKKRVKVKLDPSLFPTREEEEEIIAVHTFIEHQKELIELERKAEIEATLNEIRSISGREREIYGRAVLDLKGSRLPSRLNLYFVKFGRSQPIDTEIASGDVVLISKGDPLKSDLIGTVSEVGRNQITVAFEQQPPKWVYSFGIRIDLYINDITFKRMEENLELMRDLPPRKRELRNFALSIWHPPEPRELSFSPKTSLNESQKEAVSRSLGSDLFLIHGPPGTGKTSTLVELILQEVERGKRVLAVADSNVAVDNMLQRLARFDLELVRIGHPARILHELEKFSIYAKYEESLEAKRVREGWEEVGILVRHRDQFTKPTPARARGMSHERILTLAARGKSQRGVSVATLQSMARWIRADQKVDALVKSLKNEEARIYREIIRGADVVLSTNAMVMSDLLKEEEFDIAVIDEGSQQVPPSTLIPIMHGERFVIAGDHKQLPPTVVSREARELERSLFEDLITHYPSLSSMLKVQYRMHEKIMGFSNEQFYDGELVAHESVAHHTLADLQVAPPQRYREILDPQEPFIFVDTEGIEAPEKLPDRSTSYENPREAQLVVELVQELLQMGVKGEEIGVISPYLAQVKLLKRLFQEPVVEIKSVDGFQGREKEVIIISFVRSNREGNIGFLKDWRRLNVALTRARRKVISIGDSGTLSHEPIYRELIEYTKRRGRIVCVR